MTTPVHLLFNSVFIKSKSKKNVVAVAVGSVFPDLAAVFFAIYTTFFTDYTQEYIWNTLYYSDSYQWIFNTSHSLVFYIILATIFRFIIKKRVAFLFFLSGIVHIAFDFFLHAEDAYKHFYPVSDFIFNSPISYWDFDYGAIYWIPIEIMLTLISGYVLAKKAPSNKYKTVIYGFAILASLLIASNIYIEYLP